MIKFLFAFIFYVAVGRWIYAEVTLLAPAAVPYVDDLLARIEIPTHDYFASSRAPAPSQLARAFERRRDSNRLPRREVTRQDDFAYSDPGAAAEDDSADYVDDYEDFHEPSRPRTRRLRASFPVF